MEGGYEVLVLDDEPIVGDRLKPALEQDGHRVEIFTDPQEALRRIDAKTFDIVVTDIRMEDVDGIQVLERVLARSTRTKVIMITGYATMELAREAMGKGAFNFIAKPFKLREMRAVVNKAARALAGETSGG
jgi:DNA-binding NtrC family response regulator